MEHSYALYKTFFYFKCVVSYIYFDDEYIIFPGVVTNRTYENQV
jgi:hypothetical protein